MTDDGPHYETARQASFAAHRAGLGPPGDNEQAIRDALGGITCGTYDNRIIEWLALLDGSTVVVICSLIERARRQEVQQR